MGQSDERLKKGNNPRLFSANSEVPVANEVHLSAKIICIRRRDLTIRYYIV